MNMNKNDQNYLVEKIRTQYTEKEFTQLDQLKALDKKVKAPATRFAWTFGTVAALILGCGMSLVMTDIGTVLGLSHSLIPGIVVGVIGLVLALLTYPLYSNILSHRRKKYAKEILALSEALMEL